MSEHEMPGEGRLVSGVEIDESWPISAMLDVQARERPGQTALIFEGRELAWADFHALLDRIANGLAALGIGRGDNIAILAETSPEYVELYLGGLRAGACVVPLSGMADGPTLERMIDDSDACLLAVSTAMRGLVAPFLDRLGKIKPGGLIAFDFSAPGWTGFEGWVEGAESGAPAVEISPEDGFNIIYSSGTTGVPKGIEHSHRMRSFQIARMGRFGLGAGAVTLVSTPLYSNTTLVSLLPSLALGGTVVLMRKFDVAKFLRLSEKYAVTHAMLVPVQYQRILAHPDFDRFDLSSYRMKLSTSAPLRMEVKREALARWPGKLVEIYGLTEGGGRTVLDATEFPDKLGSVGRPGEGVEILVIDERGNELPPGETGEIVGRAVTMMTGYYKRDDLTNEIVWRDPQGRRFFRSGDMGRFDEDGFLYLLDRKKDMIISGGFNIYAADLERVLGSHEAVADVAVIGVPSERWGETPLGLVVPAPGAAITPEALLEWANGRLGKAQRLSAIEFKESLPRSTIGKVLKRRLREPYWGEGGK